VFNKRPLSFSFKLNILVSFLDEFKRVLQGWQRVAARKQKQGHMEKNCLWQYGIALWKQYWHN
jgi:hypothetical protein